MTRLPHLLLALALAAPPAAGPPPPDADAEAAPSAPVAQIDAFLAGADIDRGAPGWRTRLPRPPQVTFPAGADVLATVQTSVGPLRLRLLPDVAPMHVTVFLYLARIGFYDGLAFHLVYPGFAAQAGCPLGNGRGGPGFRLQGEFSGDARHDRRGVLTAANAGPGTDGSQFLLMFGPAPWLDDHHTIYGEVVDGWETLDALEARGSTGGATSEIVRIESITLE